MVVVENEQVVRDVCANMSRLQQLDLRGVIVTAIAQQDDFVARFFAPKYGILEDPVTGSAYTQLAPYWSQRLGKTKLTARQLSQRGGTVYCEVIGARVFIAGKAKLYLEGKIEIN